MASYSYDGLGRRITETHGSTTTDLYLSVADQVLEEDVGGVTQARNVWSLVYVNALVLRDQSSQHNGVLDQRLYVQQDANWNVTALVDTSGNVVERYDYTPFGVQMVLNPDFSVRGSSAYAVPYGFQGMRVDSTVGLQFADNRVYSPTLMRWLQTDPIGLNAGTNDYEFVGNGPMEAMDPSGFVPVRLPKYTKYKPYVAWKEAQLRRWENLIERFKDREGGYINPQHLIGTCENDRDLWSEMIDKKWNQYVTDVNNWLGNEDQKWDEETEKIIQNNQLTMTPESQAYFRARRDAQREWYRAAFSRRFFDAWVQYATAPNNYYLDLYLKWQKLKPRLNVMGLIISNTDGLCASMIFKAFGDNETLLKYLQDKRNEALDPQIRPLQPR